MHKQEAIDLLRYRLTISDNFEKIRKASQSSEVANLSDQGQLDLFSAGMDDCKENVKLDEYTNPISDMDIVNVEKELLGIPISYDPLEELSMYSDLYCTHKVTDLFSMMKNTNNIVIMDYIVEIDYRYSLKGNRYAKIQISNFNGNYYMYLFGDTFQENIHKLFIGEIYLLQISYKEPTPKFDRDSFVINNVKNIKDVEIEEEYLRLMNNTKTIFELNKKWQLKNKKHD